jgi:hypothetical protein
MRYSNFYLSSGLPLLQIVQFGYLIQQLNRFCRTRNPCSRAGQPSFEVICSCREKLIANMQRFAAFNAAEETLACKNTPRLVANVYKHIVSA